MRAIGGIDHNNVILGYAGQSRLGYGIGSNLAILGILEVCTGKTIAFVGGEATPIL